MLDQIIDVLKSSNDSLTVDEITSQLNKKGYNYKSIDILKELNQTNEIKREINPLTTYNDHSVRYFFLN